MFYQVDFMDRLKPYLVALPLLLLAGCGEDDRLHKICNNHPKLCEDLADDGTCRYDRTKVIRARYYLEQTGGDKQKYDLMKELEVYLRCIEHSTNIEYKNNKERKSPKVEGMLTAHQQLAQLDLETRSSDNPWLLLWHWTNNTNDVARRKFLALEGSPELEHPELQMALAGLYSRTHPDKAIDLMEHALTLYREGDTVNERLITSLSTLYMGQKRYDMAYLWGQVSESFQGANGVNTQRLAIYSPLGKEELAKLDERAQRIVEALKLGTYQRSME